MFGSSNCIMAGPFSEDFMHVSARSAAVVTLGIVSGVVAATFQIRAASVPFPLTVDSIMRGPKLVGYPQTGLRWSGDSSRLYFEWRRPGDDEAATYVVAKTGGEARKLSDEERRSAPPVTGAWDKAHRRVLFVDQGDIVLLDTVANTRRQMPRTVGNEGTARWARKDTAITFTRENNLYEVPVDGGAPGGPGGIVQLTDVTARKRDP